MKFAWKKMLSLSLAAAMSLSLAACGQGSAQDDSQPAAQSQTGTESTASSAPDNGQETGAGNVLVAYYSATGNTESVAN